MSKTEQKIPPDKSRDAARRSAPSASVVFEAIRREGEEELDRTTQALAWSGLAAGLSMGFSFLAEAMLQARLPDTSWYPLISKLGYSVGFLIVVLGRQQLFTENTLTPILQLLDQASRQVLWQVVRLWSIVLTANVVGGAIFAALISQTTVFDPQFHAAFSSIGLHAIGSSFSTMFVSGIFAGWLIALMVWLMPLAETARVAVIIIITYLIGIGGFPHIIAGTIEVLYVVMVGQATWSQFLFNFFLPTLCGNVVGGVSLVAVINYAQVATDTARDL